MNKPSKMNPAERVGMLLKGILNAKGDCVGCDECFEQLDRYAELVDSGKLTERDFPDVQKHLEDCVCCVQEFEALLAALEVKTPKE